MLEAECAMGLERRHVREVAAAVNEERHAPLDGFFHVGAGGVDLGTQALEDGLRKRRGVGDVGIDAGVGLDGHACVSSNGRRRLRVAGGRSLERKRRAPYRG
jgi:hypothetical protein